jgi:hypothetical protein
VASARVAFIADVSAGVCVLPVSASFVYRLDGSSDFRRAFVDAMVDVDVIDIASFSMAWLMLVRLVEVIADNSPACSELSRRG